MNTPENKPRKVVCSSLMGFSEESGAFLEESTVDLTKVKTITFFYKHIQAIHTSRKLMILYAPTDIPMDRVVTDARNLLERCEKEFVMTNPNQWDRQRHLGPFPEIKCVLDWARGTKYKEQRPGAPKENTNHRKVATFLNRMDEDDRVLPVAREYKRHGWEKGVFGEHSFFQEVHGGTHLIPIRNGMER